jgi:hypothetical protein
LSLAVQITALAGGQGIYPIAEQLSVTAESNGAWRFLAYPSIFWIAASDGALLAAAYGGCVLAVLLFAGWWERPVLVLLYLLYLSLFHAGQIFTNFQWDYLLLEAGFLAIFLRGGSRVVVWLFRWLLFRLRFLSGISKLLSGDPTWSGLTALSYYFETQPLPHAGAWYAHQLPEWLLRSGSGATLVVEILVPFLMFFPRPVLAGRAGPNPAFRRPPPAAFGLDALVRALESLFPGLARSVSTPAARGVAARSGVAGRPALRRSAAAHVAGRSLPAPLHYRPGTGRNRRLVASGVPGALLSPAFGRAAALNPYPAPYREEGSGRFLPPHADRSLGTSIRSLATRSSTFLTGIPVSTDGL